MKRKQDTLVESLDGDFSMSVKLTKVHKGELLTVDNPHYQQLIDSYSHLRGVKIEDLDSKEELPVHVVLGSDEYAQIKPTAEKTKLGWLIMSPGQEFDRNRMMLTQTNQTDYALRNPGVSGVEMKIYERSLQALFSSAPRSRVLANHASLAQTGELARRLDGTRQFYHGVEITALYPLYVDNLLNGGQTAEEARKRKSTAIEVFSDANFVLRKWNSNVAELEETHERENVHSELSFAKQQLGAQTSESKVLGLLWHKQLDTLTVTFPQDETPATKRELLKKLANVYDPLGLTTPFTLQGKLIYRDICNQKLPWDAQLTRNLTERVKKWEQTLPTGVTVPRHVINFREPVLSLE